MLGHKVWQELHPQFETFVTVRTLHRALGETMGADPARVFHADATDVERLRTILRETRPDAVVNCVGIVKQLAAAKDPIPSIEINSLLPHRLAAECRTAGARLVHISTDCVFSGKRGMYTEEDAPDAEDLYGRSKLLGEVTGERAITLRTSIIGRELHATSGLVEWFLSRRGATADGYTRAIFSGLTTAELARVIANVLEHHPGLSGLWHVSAEPIAKLELLQLLNDAYRANVTIRPSDTVTIDRSLDSTRFRAATGWSPRSWKTMVADMAADPTPYDAWRA